MLSDTDTKQIVLPKGVKLDKILVKAGESVKKGDALATVELSSVMGAMSDVQSELDKLDGELRSATGETVAPYISAGVAGRVKTVYAQKDDDVAACMMEHGALAVLSLDGYICLLYTSRGAALSFRLSRGISLPAHRRGRLRGRKEESA